MLKKTLTLCADGNNIRQVYRLTTTIEYACRISENCLPTTLKPHFGPTNLPQVIPRNFWLTRQPSNIRHNHLTMHTE